jgi:hypothetical protein
MSRPQTMTRMPAPARTRPPAGGARCTSAACRTGRPKRGCVRSPTGAPPASCRDGPRGDLADDPAFGQDLSARLVVVAGVQVHHWPRGQPAHHGDGVQRRRQQPIVAVVGWGRHCTQRDAARVGDHRALEPLLADGPPGLARPSGRRGAPWWCTRPRSGAPTPSRACGRRQSATPAVIHSSWRRRRVVAEQVWSAIRR